MPLLKRHPISTGVTLSGKNFFGTWMEPVSAVHDYHFLSFTLGNPAPQTDLFAHEHIGGKVVLYIGDGIFATPWDHAVIGKFQMYPFNNDWTNSLFFSQDPVAIDSVMYDFLHAEGTNPCEGSQNYLHQSAIPNEDTYDPENDGTYLSDSLGVHEHWNTEEDIFSSERYVGPSINGIDYITFSGEEFEADANGPYYGLVNVPIEFHGFAINGAPPYSWHWDFGDGDTSDIQNPTHKYANAGNYTVTLYVTDSTDGPNSTVNDTTWALIEESVPPPEIYGPLSGKIGVEYDYYFLIPYVTYCDALRLRVDWGDTGPGKWHGPYNTGENVTLTHTWREKGDYRIRAQVMDVFGAESDWAELKVIMPRNRAMTNLLFLRFLEQFPIMRHLLRL
jgi:hypothetical protein